MVFHYKTYVAPSYSSQKYASNRSHMWCKLNTKKSYSNLCFLHFLIFDLYFELMCCYWLNWLSIMIILTCHSSMRSRPVLIPYQIHFAPGCPYLFQTSLRRATFDSHPRIYFSISQRPTLAVFVYLTCYIEFSSIGQTAYAVYQ